MEEITAAKVTDREGSFVVTVPVNGSDAVFRFDRIAVVKGDIECFATAEMGGEKVSHRFSAFSDRSREAFVRLLKESFGAKPKWTLILSAAVDAFVDQYRKTASDGIVSVLDIVAERPSFLLYPYVEEGSANLLFSKGGVGKTFLALRIALSVASGKPFFGHSPTRTAATLFIDWENSDKTFHNRIMMANAYVGADDEALGRCYYMDSKGIPLAELADEVIAFCQANGVGLIVIDSAAPACGGSAEESLTATQFFIALRRIGVTSLIIAHEAKAEQGKFAFGSVFFTNFARNIFHLKTFDDKFQQGAVKTLTLTHNKFNNGHLQPALHFTMSTGLTGTEFKVVEDAVSETVAEKVVRCLRDCKEGELTPSDIAKIEALKLGSVKNAIAELKADGIIMNGSSYGKWGLKPVPKQTNHRK